MELPAGCGQREVHVFCSVNYNGLIRFPRACMKIVETDEAAAAAAAAPSKVSPAAPYGAAADGEQQQQQEQQVDGDQGLEAESSPTTSASTKIKITELPIHRVLYPGRPSERELGMYRESELQMDNEDRMHREKQERLNELETIVYAVRDGLGGPLGPFAAEAEKEALSRLLGELEDWVYEHQNDPDVSKRVIISKIDSLKQLAAPVQHRQQQRELRQIAAEKMRNVIQVK